MSNKKGITLIALVITIVVLLILSGIRIVIEVNDGGVISKAEDVREKNEDEEINEIFKRLVVYNNSNRVNVEKTKEKLEEYFGENINFDPLTNLEDGEKGYKISIVGKYDKYPFELKEEGIIKLNELQAGYAYAILTEDGTLYFTRSEIILNKTNTLTYKEKNVQNIFGYDGSMVNTDFEKGEIGIGWRNCSSEIKNVIFEKSIKPENTQYWFSEFSNCVYMDLKLLDMQDVTDMKYMFSGCSNLTSLDVSNFNTAKVTNMNSVFCNCSSLISLDVSNFNTENVKNMMQLFYNCSSLTSLDVSNFNTAKVESMKSMFYNCSSLTKLDVSNFDTSKVKDMMQMFCACNSLTKLDVSNFDTSKVEDMKYMFSACSSLKDLDLSSFINTAMVTNMGNMFDRCVKLTNIKGISNFKTENVTDMNNMFNQCYLLESLDLSKWTTGKLETTERMFYQCKALKEVGDISKWNVEQVVNMSKMFGYAGTLKVNCSNWIVKSSVLHDGFDSGADGVIPPNWGN